MESTVALKNISDATVKTTSHKTSISSKKSWKKPSKDCLHTNFNDAKEESKGGNFSSSNKGSSSSTLSLHIAAYENYIEGQLADCLADKEEFKTKATTIITATKNPEQQSSSGSSFNERLEFPRQQNNVPLKPEIQQFSASQRLLTPNQESIHGVQYRNYNYWNMVHKHAGAIDYKPIGDNKFRESSCLIQASSTIPIESAEFPGFLTDTFKEKFKSCCKFALSPKNQLLALITPDRELELYGLKESSAVPKCRLRVLYDAHPECCLLEWSASQNLLISTRSSPVIDVFESTGVYCYTINLDDNLFDVHKMITQIKTIPSGDPQCFDIGYFMQMNSKFSIYKLGKGNMFEPLCTQSLGLPRAYCFAYVPSKHFLIVSTEYSHKKAVDSTTKFTDVGLGLFECYERSVVKKVVPDTSSQWTSWLPMLSDKRSAIISLEVNFEDELILAVTSRGDALVFNFYLELIKHLNGDEIINEARFVQAIWTEGKEIAVLHRNGLVIQENVDVLFEKYLEGTLQGTIIEDCKNLFPSFLTETEIFALAEKEASSHALVSDNDYVNQFWFFTLFRLSFVYKWIKVLSGAIVGQPMEEVESDFERLFKFSIYKIRTITLLQYVKKLLSKEEYAKAEELALTDPNFEMDLIHKQKWLDLKASEISQSLVEDLKRVKDDRWVIQECLTSSAAEVEIQREILNLAEERVADLEDTVLSTKVQNAKLLFECLENSFDDSMELFIRYRSMPVLETALHLAQESAIKLLIRIVTEHAGKLQNSIIAILSLIPEAVPIHRYQALIPWTEKGEDRLFVLNKDAYKGGNLSLPEPFSVYEKYLLNSTEDPIQFVTEWCRERVMAIDSNTGLLENVTAFFDVAMAHGFEGLQPTMRKFNFYKDFVCFSSAVAMSFDKFLGLDSVTLRNGITKHMKESQIRDNISRIVELFEEFHPKTAAEDILQIVRTFSHKNFALLHSLWSIRRNLVSKDLLISCFSESTLLGPPLICTMEKFEFEPSISEAIQICLDFGFEPRFSVLFESRTSDELAEQLLLRFLKSSFQMPEPNWIMIFDGIKNLRNLLFPEIIDDQKLMKIFASEMLTKLANERFLGFPFHLVVDINSENSKKLSMENWQDLLLAKSLEFIDRALPKSNDQNLSLAREVLTLIPGKQKPSKEIEKQKETISMIETCIQMGSQRLPATYRFCSPEVILQEVISSNKNYKQVKKCAEISKMLGLKPAVAKAMAYCAVEAAKSDDVSTLQKYIQKLNSTSRDMPIIYFVCKDIITSGKWQHLKEDLVNCMVLNCPEEELEFLSEVLKSIDVVRRFPGSLQNTSSDSSMKETITNFTTKFLDPLTKKENTNLSFKDDDELHLDPMYTSPDHFHQLSHGIAPPPITVVNEDNGKEVLLESAKQWIPYSSTAAIVTAALAEDTTRWAKHDILNQATLGLKKLIEMNENIPLKVLEKIPTEILLKLAEEKVNEGEITAVERILRAGCDRERFFEDAEYREDSLLGLIMTKNKSMIMDIQEVAKQFNVSLWKLNMSLVEYILTEEDVTPMEAKDLIKEYNLRELLWEDQPTMYQTLRHSVLALLPEKDINRLKLFLSFFRPPEPEVYFFKALSSIIKVDSSTNLKEFLQGDQKTILTWTNSITSNSKMDEEFIALIPFFKKLPNSGDLISKLASTIRMSPNLSSIRRIKLLFYLNDKKAELLIDQISDDMSSTNEEEAFWNEVLDGWDTTEDKYENRLLEKIRRRIHHLKSSAATSSTDSVPSSLKSNEETQKFEMRRRGGR